MRTRFNTPQWHAAVARLVRSGDAPASCDALIAAIDIAVDHEGTCLLAFHRDAPPQVLHHTLEPAGAAHYLDRYLAGPYLLDPLYQLALTDDKPTVCRFRDQTPDRFRSSQYYRQYCEQTHLLDEMDFILDVDMDCALVLVVGRRAKMFAKAELDRIRLIEPVVRAAMQNIWERFSAQPTAAEADGSLHRRLTRCFANFGDTTLTEVQEKLKELGLRLGMKVPPATMIS